MLRLAARLAACVAIVLAGTGLPLRTVALELQRAERIVAGGAAQQVDLPDEPEAPPGAPALRVLYRLSAELGPQPHALGLYLPGLIAQARIRINGHVLLDTLPAGTPVLPRSSDRLQLLRLPDEFVHAGRNDIEVEAVGVRRLSLSPLWLDRLDRLERAYDARLLGAVIGPLLVATVMGGLALCVLLLWARRPAESLYGLFGAGTLCWALHSAWTVLPMPLLRGAHLGVWWTAMYSWFVVLLVLFCLRLAGWHWPRVERGLCAMALAAVPLLYGAAALDRLAEAAEAWRLLCIAVVAMGVAAVVHHAWRRRDVASALLLASGMVSLGFGLRDWAVAHAGRDNNPVFLTPYAGLSFVVLVAWRLIDGFVRATQQLELANAGLEVRVARSHEDLRQALAQMRDARDRAQAADQAKSRFLAVASHDLRQPVHALGLYLASIAPAGLPAAARDTLARMEQSLSALGSMFDALLDVSRIDAGVIVPQPRPFDADALLRRLGEEFAPLAERRGLRLLLHGDARSTHWRVQADPVLVERIVRNLLANAVRYTRHGGVLLAWRLRERPGRHWRIEVRDSGPGIARAIQPRVFDEFFQGQGAAEGTDEDTGDGGGDGSVRAGLGLGLAIVRRLATLMDLPLALQSVPGRGTRVRLQLPATAQAALAPLPLAEPALAAGAWICVVEDDGPARAAMRRLLVHWGCRVLAGPAAEPLLAAWQHAGRPPVAAIVADLQLGQGDGLQAVARLRQAFAEATLPALVLTGDSSPEAIARLAGAALPWLGKPVPPARLRQWLVHAIGDTAAAPP